MTSAMGLRCLRKNFKKFSFLDLNKNKDKNSSMEKLKILKMKIKPLSNKALEDSSLKSRLYIFLKNKLYQINELGIKNQN